MVDEQLGSLRLRSISVSSMDNNVYLLTASTGEQLLIDAADDAAAILSLVRDEGGPVHTVVTTHRHWDHHRALEEIVAVAQARTAAGEADADHLPVPVDIRLQHGDTLVLDEAASVSLAVLSLRGHTPGSVALALTEPPDAARAGRVHLFTGDSLFPGGPGKTQTPEDFRSLMTDLEARLFDVYPDDTVVWPGHGKPTTLGAERPHLREWWARGW